MLSYLIGFAVLVVQSNSLSVSWKTIRRAVTVTRSSEAVLPSSCSIRNDAMRLIMHSPTTTCSTTNNRRSKLLSRMKFSTGKEEGTKRPVDKERYSGLKNAIMMGTPLFIKFFIVMIVKFVKDVTIFPTIYMIKFIKKVAVVVSKKNKNSSEEDLDLTRVRSLSPHPFLFLEDNNILFVLFYSFFLQQKVIMGGPGTKF